MRGVREVLRLNYLVGFVNIVLESRCVAIHVYSSTRDDMYVDAVTHSPIVCVHKIEENANNEKQKFVNIIRGGARMDYGITSQVIHGAP